MTTDGADEQAVADERSWLADHIGRLAGLVLGGAAIGFLAFLAAIGFSPALGVLVALVAGVAMIAIGGAMRRR